MSSLEEIMSNVDDELDEIEFEEPDIDELFPDLETNSAIGHEFEKLIFWAANVKEHKSDPSFKKLTRNVAKDYDSITILVKQLCPAGSSRGFILKQCERTTRFIEDASGLCLQPSNVPAPAPKRQVDAPTPVPKRRAVEPTPPSPLNVGC
jgi:hypothetical protein